MIFLVFNGSVTTHLPYPPEWNQLRQKIELCGDQTTLISRITVIVANVCTSHIFNLVLFAYLNLTNSNPITINYAKFACRTGCDLWPNGLENIQHLH